MENDQQAVWLYSNEFKLWDQGQFQPCGQQTSAGMLFTLEALVAVSSIRKHFVFS